MADDSKGSHVIEQEASETSLQSPTSEEGEHSPSLLDEHRVEYQKILLFLEEIGLPYRKESLEQPTDLPGIALINGEVVIDEEKLKYPGDILHEAGRLAILLPKQRSTYKDSIGANPADEIATIAWSWAALVYVGIDPDVVFHSYGYRGGSYNIISGYLRGDCTGAGMLQYYGMCLEPWHATDEQPGFPQMIQWLRVEMEEDG